MNKIYIKNKSHDTVFELNEGKFTYVPFPLSYKEIPCHRPHILGNPYTSKSSKLAKVKVATPKEAVHLYASFYFPEKSLPHPSILSEIKNIEKLFKIYNICLTCWCAPSICHTTIIAKYLMSQVDSVP